LSSFAVFFFHTEWSKKTIIVFLSIFLIGFFIEVAGVKTGVIFGRYTYGSALSLKFLDTPVIIGLNWLLLVYISSSVVDRLKTGTVFKVLLSASVLLLYDLILEQVAPKLDMWRWDNNTVPVQNYIAWFSIAFIFSGYLKTCGIKLQNNLAAVILICQTAFFTILYFTL